MRRAVALLTFVLAAGCGGDAGAEAGPLRLVEVGRFDAPVHVTAPPGDRRHVHVVEQGGTVRVLRNGRRLRRPFLDLRRQVTAGGEQGLLSIAFAPDFARSRKVYAAFTDRDARQRIVELRAPSAARADPASQRTLLVMDDPEPNHNGGLLLFGPDGRLYTGTGDGGGGDDQHGTRGNAQDPASPLGKILRLDPRRRPAVPQVVALGLRNPWRFDFDRTGALVVADVGQSTIEEVSIARVSVRRPANFGWRPWEGNVRRFEEPAPGHVRPAIEHAHADGFCSISGGVVVRDPRLPELAGRFVYGDLCEGRVRAARLRLGRRARSERLALPEVPRLAAFGEDARRRVYAISVEGPVLRLERR